MASELTNKNEFPNHFYVTDPFGTLESNVESSPENAQDNTNTFLCLKIQRLPAIKYILVHQLFVTLNLKPKDHTLNTSHI